MVTRLLVFFLRVTINHVKERTQNLSPGPTNLSLYPEIACYLLSSMLKKNKPQSFDVAQLAKCLPRIQEALGFDLEYCINWVWWWMSGTLVLRRWWWKIKSPTPSFVTYWVRVASQGYKRPCLKLGEGILVLAFVTWYPAQNPPLISTSSGLLLQPTWFPLSQILSVGSQDLLMSVFLQGLVPGLTYANL